MPNSSFGRQRPLESIPSFINAYNSRGGAEDRYTSTTQRKARVAKKSVTIENDYSSPEYRNQREASWDYRQQESSDEERRNDWSSPRDREERLMHIVREQEERLEDLENQLARNNEKKLAQTSEGDLLDYICEGVEHFVCRHDEDQAGYEAEDDNSIIEEGYSSQQKLPSRSRDPGVRTNEPPRNVLDYMFECGPRDEAEENMVIVRTLQHILDNVFECGADGDDGVVDIHKQRPPDSRDIEMRAPANSPERKYARPRSSSYISAYLLDETPTEDCPPIGRLEILRRKKRRLEARQQMASGRNIIVEHMDVRSESRPESFDDGESLNGDLDNIATENPNVPTYSRPKIPLDSRSPRLAHARRERQNEQRRKVRLTLLAGLLMFLAGAGFIGIAVLIFYQKK